MSDNKASGGLGFTSVLTIVFIVLKLTGHIDWAWIWVLAPTWIAVSLVLLFVVFCVFMAMITSRR